MTAGSILQAVPHILTECRPGHAVRGPAGPRFEADLCGVCAQLENIQNTGQGLVNNITSVGNALTTASNAVPSLETQLQLYQINPQQLLAELQTAEAAVANAASSGQNVLNNLQSDGINVSCLDSAALF